MQNVITLKSILAVATSIASDCDAPSALTRASLLLNYVATHAKTLLKPPKHGFFARSSKDDSDKFEDELKELRAIAWLPAMTTAPVRCLPWPTHSSILIAPKRARSSELAWLCSGTFGLVSLDGAAGSSTETLLEKLGLLDPIPAVVLARQVHPLARQVRLPPTFLVL